MTVATDRHPSGVSAWREAQPDCGFLDELEALGQAFEQEARKVENVEPRRQMQPNAGLPVAAL